MESEAMKVAMTYIDPITVTYLSIGVFLFSLFAYKIQELRIFIIPVVLLWFSIFFMWLEIHDAEAVFLMISGITSTFSIVYYRYKVKTGIYGGG